MLGKCKDHLDSVHESYGQHLRFALCFGMRMMAGGIAAILHGLCPAIFQTNGSRTLFRLYDEIKARQASKVEPE